MKSLNDVGRSNEIKETILIIKNSMSDSVKIKYGGKPINQNWLIVVKKQYIFDDYFVKFKTDVSWLKSEIRIVSLFLETRSFSRDDDAGLAGGKWGVSRLIRFVWRLYVYIYAGISRRPVKIVLAESPCVPKCGRVRAITKIYFHNDYSDDDRIIVVFHSVFHLFFIFTAVIVAVNNFRMD